MDSTRSSWGKDSSDLSDSRIVQVMPLARITGRKSIMVVITIGLLVGGSGLVYHFASPKIELRNFSQTSFDEFVLQLPSSRVSIAPVKPESFERVYFSTQSRDGTVHYSLWSGGVVIVEGECAFSAEGQLFRKVRVVIQPDGSIAVEIRN
jgi:hypothetical protein